MIDRSVSQGIITGATRKGVNSSSIFEIESFPAAWIQPTDDVASAPYQNGNWLSFDAIAGFYSAYKSFCWILPCKSFSKLAYFSSIEYPHGDYNLGRWDIWGGDLQNPASNTFLAGASVPNDIGGYYGYPVEFNSGTLSIDISPYNCLKIAMRPSADTVGGSVLGGFYEPIAQGYGNPPPGLSNGLLPFSYLAPISDNFPVFAGGAENLITKYMKVGLSK